MTQAQITDIREGAEVGALLGPEHTLALLDDLNTLQVAIRSIIVAMDKLMTTPTSRERGMAIGKLMNQLNEELNKTPQ